MMCCTHVHGLEGAIFAALERLDALERERETSPWK
jgi:hypothetical protein